MRRLTLALILVASCDSDTGVVHDAGFDATLDAGGLASLTCPELKERFAAELALLDRSCDQASDCAVVGGVDSCECTAHISANCIGAPVQRAAYDGAADRIQPIRAEWNARCLDACTSIECTCDCPPGTAGCSASGVCTATEIGSCFPDPPPDAGP